MSVFRPDRLPSLSRLPKEVGREERFCEGKVAEVRTAVLYEKSHSVVQCDYVWRRTDLWINFPWSDKDPVATRAWAVRDA